MALFTSPFLGGGGDSSGVSAGTVAGGIGAAAGLGASIFGGLQQMDAASQQSSISKNITGLEQQAEGQRMQSMELSARRQSMEVLRQNQRAQAMATNNATNQGAQFGSGLQGGLAQVADQSGVNLQGINQNLEIGRNMFAINSQISQQKIQMADAKSREATGGAIAGLGKSIGGSIGPIINLGAQLAPLLLL